MIQQLSKGSLSPQCKSQENSFTGRKKSFLKDGLFKRNISPRGVHLKICVLTKVSPPIIPSFQCFFTVKSFLNFQCKDSLLQAKISPSNQNSLHFKRKLIFLLFVHVPEHKKRNSSASSSTQKCNLRLLLNLVVVVFFL